MKKVLSVLLSCVIALSSCSVVALANNKSNNISEVGTTSKAQMAVIEGYGKYESLYMRYLNYGNDSGLAILENFFNENVPKISDISSERAQIARAKALYDVYIDYFRFYPDGDKLITGFENLAGKALPNPSLAVQGAAAESFAGVISASARQPEMGDEAMAIKDAISPEIKDLNSDEVQIGRAKALSSLYEGVARQPEMESYLVSIFTETLGEKPVNPSAKVQAAYVEAMYNLIVAMGRQPEMEQRLLNVHNQLAPEITLLSSEEVQIARGYIMGAVYETIARQPEFENELLNVLEKLVGKKPLNNSAKVQGAYAFSYGKFIESITRQPEIKDHLLAFASEWGTKVQAFNSDEVQIGRANALKYLYFVAYRQPDALDDYTALFKDLLGNAPANANDKVKGAYLYSDVGYIQTLNNSPETKAVIDNIKASLSVEVTDFDNEPVQVARAKAINELLRVIVSGIESDPSFEDVIIDVLGAARQIHSFEVKLNYNNGSDVQSVLVYNNKMLQIPFEPVREGYNFVCWMNGDKEFKLNTPISESLVLSAKWEPVSIVEDSIGEQKSPQTGNCGFDYLAFGVVLCLGGFTIAISRLKKKVK